MSMAELSRLESSEGGSRVMSLDDSDISNGVETFETSSNGRTQAPTHASICCMHLVSFPPAVQKLCEPIVGSPALHTMSLMA